MTFEREKETDVAGQARTRKATPTPGPAVVPGRGGDSPNALIPNALTACMG
jgi:hypothetical protein